MLSGGGGGGGGGAAFKLNLDLIKTPTSTYAYSSSSSSSSSSSLSARKARTPRKRPNQMYNEAASILSTAHPKLFPAKPFKYTKSLDHKKSPLLYEPSDLLLPIERFSGSSGRPNFSFGPKNSLNLFDRQCSSVNASGGGEYDQEDLSILDEEMEEGIDSIMGDQSMENEKTNDFFTSTQLPNASEFDFGNGMRNELRAMRDVDGGDDWWRFPIVNLADITRKIAEIPVEKKKRKMKKKENSDKETSGEEALLSQTRGGLNLKLNYEDVLRAWSDRGSPFSGHDDVRARLAQIDLFPENDLSYNAKEHSHLVSKRIRHQVKKNEVDQRPRLKDKFVRPPI